MPKSKSRDLVDVLELVSAGERSLRRLATALKDNPEMAIVVPPNKLAEYLQALGAAFAAAEGGGAALQPVYPQPVGRQDKDGRFVPCVFSSPDLAQHFARANGLAIGDQAPAMTLPWVAGFREFLRQGYGGVIVDDGTEHALPIVRGALVRLYSQITLVDLARSERLWVVMANGKVHAQKSWRGERQVFVYDSEVAAEAGNEKLRGQGSPARAAKVDTQLFLRQSIRAEVGMLVVNPTQGDERFYDPDDLVRLERAAAGEDVDEVTVTSRIIDLEQSDPAVELEDTGVAIKVPSYAATDLPAEEAIAVNRGIRTRGRAPAPEAAAEPAPRPAPKPKASNVEEPPRRGGVRRSLSFGKKDE